MTTPRNQYLIKIMQLDDIRLLVAQDLTATDALILSRLASDIPLASEIADYVVKSGGKRIRPLLCLLAAKAISYSGQDHIKLAAIIELLHTATLLHDDVIDASTLRRGRDTANSKWGNEASVLVGDLLYSRAFQLIAELDCTAITQLIANASSLIVEGEVLQLAHCRDVTTSENTYLEIIKRKTGCLFMVASSAIAHLTRQPPELAQALAAYGENLGIAFQMLDDALDYDANPKITGKNIGDDLAEGKPTLPLICVLSDGDTLQAQTVRQAIESPETADVNVIKQIIDSVNAIAYTRQLAQTYVKKSIAAVEILPSSSVREALIALAHLAGNRNA